MLTEEQLRKKLQNEVETAFLAKYGPDPEKQLCDRLREEWAVIAEAKQEGDILLLLEISRWLKDTPHWMDFCSGASFILYLLKITRGNPLPPHYWCPKCHQVVFFPNYKDGFDLPGEEYCGTDFTLMDRDGHNIPWQSLWGYRGEPASFGMKLPRKLYNEFRTMLKSRMNLFLEDGTELKEKELDMGPYGKKMQLVAGKLHFDFCLDEKSWQPESLKDLICNWALMYDDSELTRKYPAPDTFADLVKIEGILHNDYVQNPLTEELLSRSCQGLKDLITCREEVFQSLLKDGLSKENARYVMELVRKGRKLTSEAEKMLEAADSSDIEQYKNISYLVPKGMIIEYLLYILGN